jgi:hypothetical protein
MKRKEGRGERIHGDEEVKALGLDGNRIGRQKGRDTLPWIPGSAFLTFWFGHFRPRQWNGQAGGANDARFAPLDRRAGELLRCCTWIMLQGDWLMGRVSRWN